MVSWENVWQTFEEWYEEHKDSDWCEQQDKIQELVEANS